MDLRATFPLELIITVSEFLAGDDALQTLASVNVASKSVKQATLPVLYNTVIWEDGKDHWRYDDLATATSRYFPSGWQHTRILFIDEHANRSLNSFVEEVNPDLTILALFPKLQILVLKDYGDELLSWPTPLRSCLVEVWAPVPVEVFTEIQECPLWWPEHQEDCGKSVDSGAGGIDVRSPGSRLAATLFDLIFAKVDTPEPLSDVDSLDSPELGSSTAGQREDSHRDTTYRPCTCLRLPFDNIGEICFMPNGFLLEGSGAGRLPCMLRQVHSDIKIFAGWKAADDRIQETLHSLIRVFGCLNYHDVNRARPVCNLLFRGPSVGLVPFTRALPKLLSCNSDIYLLLQFHDRPSISNATFVEIMQRMFDQCMLKLGHISACRSTSKAKRTTLLAVEFPAVKGLKKYRLELASEIAWHQPASLQLKTTACREPSYQTEILSDSIGLQVWPRIVLPDAPDDEEDEVFYSGPETIQAYSKDRSDGMSLVS